LVAANAIVLLAELGELVKSTVERSPGSTVRDRLAMAARTLRLTPSRVTDWWYGEVRRVEAHEADSIREFARRARETEIGAMERRLDRLRADLAQLDPLDGIRPAAARRRSRRDNGRQRGASPA